MAMQGMSVRKTDDFIADVERQFEWYAVNGGREVSERWAMTIILHLVKNNRHCT